jgi:hypothetical protein
MPLKKSIRLKKSTHLNKSTRHSVKSPHLAEYIRLAGRTGAGTIALAVVSVVAAALMLAGHPPYPAAIENVDTQARTAAPQDGSRTAAHRDQARTSPQQDGSKTATLDGAKMAAHQDGAKKAAAMAPAGAVAAKTLAADARAAIALPAESATKAPEPQSEPVTITGCLERADETFRLKDATGVDAPKSRSWKSGFLKKGPASIEIVDAANRLKLPDHVGQRISVTGTLTDRAMQVRSLQRIAASCTNSARVRI